MGRRAPKSRGITTGSLTTGKKRGRWAVVLGKGRLHQCAVWRCQSRTQAKRLANKMYGHWSNRIRRWSRTSYGMLQPGWLRYEESDDE